VVVMLPPQYVRPYVVRNKTDRKDVDGLLEAFRNDRIKPVPIKSVTQQVLGTLHRLTHGLWPPSCCGLSAWADNRFDPEHVPRADHGRPWVARTHRVPRPVFWERVTRPVCSGPCGTAHHEAIVGHRSGTRGIPDPRGGPGAAPVAAPETSVRELCGPSKSVAAWTGCVGAAARAASP
jgi:hypothetical protein